MLPILAIHRHRGKCRDSDFPSFSAQSVTAQAASALRILSTAFVKAAPKTQGNNFPSTSGWKR